MPLNPFPKLDPRAGIHCGDDMLYRGLDMEGKSVIITTAHMHFLVQAANLVSLHKDKSCSGARVVYCGHSGWFVADILHIGTACVVRAANAVSAGSICRTDMEHATHHLLDFPVGGFWRPDLGVFVVPEDQLRVLEVQS